MIRNKEGLIPLKKENVLILVAGGSASGKSTVVEEILTKSGLNDVAIIKHDDYYKNQDHLTMEERLKVNYDHPHAFDNELLVAHLNSLLSGESILKPTYNFLTYTRNKEKELLLPKKVIIVEGLLVLENEDLRELADIKLFVELDDDTRFIRRLLRDIKERGRSLESVVSQYLETVKPMYHRFIRPTKRYADVIIPNDRTHSIAVDIIVAKIKEIIGG